jgi:hypothetical protein
MADVTCCDLLSLVAIGLLGARGLDALDAATSGSVPLRYELNAADSAPAIICALGYLPAVALRIATVVAIFLIQIALALLSASLATKARVSASPTRHMIEPGPADETSEGSDRHLAHEF